MKPSKFACLIILPFLLGGCGTGWVGLDGAAVDSARIKQAMTRCQVEEIELELHYQEIATEAAVMTTTNADARDSLEESYELARRKAQAIIDECMAGEGLKAKD